MTWPDQAERAVVMAGQGHAAGAVPVGLPRRLQETATRCGQLARSA